jgi:hypothetical protein
MWPKEHTGLRQKALRGVLSPKGMTTVMSVTASSSLLMPPIATR